MKQSKEGKETAMLTEEVHTRNMKELREKGGRKMKI
jgi:hypothetical protein